MSLLNRRNLMAMIMEYEEMKEWKTLEDVLLTEAMSWDKTYDETYNEYICYIEMPKIENQIETQSSMIFGTGVIYYVSIGNATYTYGIFVKLKKITDQFILTESGRNPLAGLTGNIPESVRILNTFSTKIRTSFEFPADTHIWVFAR